jgi:hypothetical protein
MKAVDAKRFCACRPHGPGAQRGDAPQEPIPQPGSSGLKHDGSRLVWAITMTTQLSGVVAETLISP